MEPTLDFSFHKNNPLAPSDDIESPKPMPSPPPLPLTRDDHEEIPPENQDIASVSSPSALEVIETLSISPAKSADIVTPDKSCASAGQELVLAVNPAVQASPDETQDSKVKSKPRAKVPLERGFTQMDWLKLTRTEPDLAGLKGMTNRRLIPLSEVKQHRSEDDAWTVLKGQVYNITPYLKFHPGGSDMLMKGSGKDCTALFNKYHSWVNAEFLLEKCLVGFLDVEH